MRSRFRREITLYRTAHGQYVNGLWVEGVETTSTIIASVQPATPDDMELLPEGRRNRQAHVLFTDSLLKQAEDDNGTNADRVEFDGRTHEVSAVQNWRNGLISHTRAVVTLEPQQ